MVASFPWRISHGRSLQPGDRSEHTQSRPWWAPVSWVELVFCETVGCPDVRIDHQERITSH